MLVHTSDLWLLCAFVQVAIALLIRRSTNVQVSFKAFIHLQIIATPAELLALRYFGNGAAYFRMFYGIEITTDLLMVLFAYEVYRTVFGPRKALQHLVPEYTTIMVTMAATSIAALVVYAPVVLGGQLTHAMIKMEQMMTAGTAATLIILVIYSLSLRIAWPRRIAGLAAGFILYLTIDAFAVFARARGGYQVAALAGEIGKCAYLLALVWWTMVLWRKELASLPIMSEQVEVMKKFQRPSMEALAVCGVKVKVPR